MEIWEEVTRRNFHFLLRIGDVHAAPGLTTLEPRALPCSAADLLPPFDATAAPSVTLAAASEVRVYGFTSDYLSQRLCCGRAPLDPC